MPVFLFIVQYIATIERSRSEKYVIICLIILCGADKAYINMF